MINLNKIQIIKNNQNQKKTIISTPLKKTVQKEITKEDPTKIIQSNKNK